jgi:hypothetical protein
MVETLEPQADHRGVEESLRNSLNPFLSFSFSTVSKT